MCLAGAGVWGLIRGIEWRDKPGGGYKSCAVLMPSFIKLHNPLVTVADYSRVEDNYLKDYNDVVVKMNQFSIPFSWSNYQNGKILVTEGSWTGINFQRCVLTRQKWMEGKWRKKTENISVRIIFHGSLSLYQKYVFYLQVLLLLVTIRPLSIHF